jgi:hypothetical protein
VQAVNNLLVGPGVFWLGASGHFDGNRQTLRRFLRDADTYGFELAPGSMWRGSGIDPRQVGGQDLSPKAEFKWPVGTEPCPPTWAPVGRPVPTNVELPEHGSQDHPPRDIAAQALGWIDERTRAITPPIHVSSTYLRDPDNQYRSGRVYARADNPAFDQAEAVINALEGGHQTLLFASGMAAATAVFQALAPGDHVLAPRSCTGRCATG